MLYPKLNLQKCFLLLLIVLLPLTICAQPDGPCDDPDGEGCAPIDGGISLLIAAGAGYGAKKRYHMQKKKERPGS